MFVEQRRNTVFFFNVQEAILIFSRDQKFMNLDFDLDCSSQCSDPFLYLQSELQLYRRSVVILKSLNGFQSAL